MSRLYTNLEYVLVCPCDLTIHGVGLIHHLHTKKRWYRLHQKSCSACKMVRFDDLMSGIITDPTKTRHDLDVESRKLEDTLTRSIQDSLLTDTKWINSKV